MTSKPKALLAWSSGKDSAWTLHVMRQQDQVEIVGLLTTINETFDRVAMHAVRRELVEAQAKAAGLPLWRVPIPWPCPNEIYEQRMAEAVAKAKADGITQIAFGDLFLEDVRQYRVDKLAGTGVEPIFPVWKLPTDKLAREMIAAGVQTVITCVDPKQLDPSFAGRAFDEQLLADLPADADPCGENGEFHSFCHAGPMYIEPIPVKVGEIVERDGFRFADVLPA